MIDYTMQKNTKEWISFGHAAEKPPFSEIFAYYLLFNLNRDVFRVFSWEKNLFAPRLQAGAFGKAVGPVSKKKAVAAAVWDRSAAVDEHCYMSQICTWNMLKAHWRTMLYIQSS